LGLDRGRKDDGTLAGFSLLLKPSLYQKEAGHSKHVDNSPKFLRVVLR